MLPGSLKSRAQVPTWLNVTTPPLIEQSPRGGAVNGDDHVCRPEVAVAVGVKVAPPTTALDGAVEVMVMELAPWPTLTT